MEILEMKLKKIIRPKVGHATRVHDPFYTSQAWQKYRKAFLADFPFCVDCQNEGVTTMALVVDHIHQRSKGGADFPPFSGLRGLCRHHDSVRQAKQSNE